MVLTGLGLTFTYMPVDVISLSVGIDKIATIFIACLPFVFAGCALMVLVASFTKSYKEAQSYSIPHDDVNIPGEASIHMLRCVEVNEVTKMVVHIDP